MAELKIQIPDADVPRLVAALIEDSPPPDGTTQLQWARQRLRNFLKAMVHRYEGRVAAKTAVDAIVPPDLEVNS